AYRFVYDRDDIARARYTINFAAVNDIGNVQLYSQLKSLPTPFVPCQRTLANAMSNPAAHVLVLGTRNRKKGGELLDLLWPLGVEVRTLADYPQALDVIEDGETFAANAAKKATQQARHLGQWVLGEDSGLAVDALGGAPGVRSARFSDPGATDERNNALLLEKLKDVRLDERTAHYTCHAVLSDPEGNVRAESEGICRGR